MLSSSNPVRSLSGLADSRTAPDTPPPREVLPGRLAGLDRQQRLENTAEATPRELMIKDLNPTSSKRENRRRDPGRGHCTCCAHQARGNLGSCAMNRRATRSTAPSSPIPTPTSSRPCPTGPPCSHRTTRQGTFHPASPLSPTGHTRVETRTPHVPTPPPPATDTSHPSDDSAMTRTPARRPSSRTAQDDDLSAQSRGHARNRQCTGPRRIPSPMRTPETLPPSPRSGPSPSAYPAVLPSLGTPRTHGKRRRAVAACRCALCHRPTCLQYQSPGRPVSSHRWQDGRPPEADRSPPHAAPLSAPRPTRRTPRSGTASGTPRTQQGSCCSRSTARTGSLALRWLPKAPAAMLRRRLAQPPRPRRPPPAPARGKSAGQPPMAATTPLTPRPDSPLLVPLATSANSGSPSASEDRTSRPHRPGRSRRP